MSSVGVIAHALSHGAGSELHASNHRGALSREYLTSASCAQASCK